MNPKVLSSRTHLLSAVLVATALPGCLVDLDHHHSADYYEGTLTVDWTIQSGKDAIDCRANGADAIAIDVTTPSGRLIDSYQDDCEQFSSTIPLSEGSYAGTAVLLDRGGREITTPVDLGDFRVYEDADTLIPINFPRNSFR
jgi:hypothetical protein